MTQDSHKTSSDSNFSDFGLNETLVQTLAELGYQTPTAIQAQTIPLLLQGEDVLGTAQTGTGKTAAFALPMLQQIDLSRNQPQVLVLTPTRELAIQVSESFEKYASRMQGLRVAAIYGGQDYQVQFRKLSRGAHVIVGTPGRVMDHMRRESLVLEGIRCLVLDEADEMLRMGFAEDVEHILGHLPDERQIALFSATMPEPIRQIAAQHLRTPAEINIRRKAATAETIRQRFVVSTIAQKQAALQRILEVEPIDGVLVFVKTRMTCEPLAESLADCGYRTAALHGDIAQKQRERIIDQLRAGNLDIIVATDVAARGLDVPRISHVFNYDLPFDSEAYVHRIGRTGRAGRSGEAILFVSPRERMRLKRLEQATRQSIEPMELPTNRDINKRRVAKFHAKLEAALGHKDLESFSSIVEQFRKTRDDVTMEQIAAALAVLANGQNALLERNEWKPATFQTDERRRDRPSRDRDERPGRSSPRDRGGPARNRDEAMETFRIEVGREHGVSPGNIVGAIANEIGIDAAYIGRIEIRDDYSMVDLPEGLPNDLFQTLQRVHVLGKKLNISRVTGGPGRESRDRRARVSDEPSSRRSNRAQGGEVKKRVKKRRPTAI